MIVKGGSFDFLIGTVEYLPAQLILDIREPSLLLGNQNQIPSIVIIRNGHSPKILVLDFSQNQIGADAHGSPVRIAAAGSPQGYGGGGDIRLKAVVTAGLGQLVVGLEIGIGGNEPLILQVGIAYALPLIKRMGLMDEGAERPFAQELDRKFIAVHRPAVMAMS